MSEFLADAQERSTILKVVHRRVMNRQVVFHMYRAHKNYRERITRHENHTQHIDEKDQKCVQNSMENHLPAILGEGGAAVYRYEFCLKKLFGYIFKG